MSSLVHELDGVGETISLVQITDTHLCRDEGVTLLGLDTDFSLRCVIDLVKQEVPGVHAVLATGDIADNGAATAYQRAAAAHTAHRTTAIPTHFRMTSTWRIRYRSMS